MKRTCLFLILLLLAACRTTQTLQTDTTREVRIVERDTLITIAPDSATVRALLDCDSTNQVILRRLETRNGTRIAATAKTTESTGSLLFSVDCHEDSLSRELRLRDSIITTLRTEQRTIEVPAPLTRWQSFCLVLGYAAAILLALTLLTLTTIFIFKLAKRY